MLYLKYFLKTPEFKEFRAEFINDQATVIVSFSNLDGPFFAKLGDKPTSNIENCNLDSALMLCGQLQLAAKTHHVYITYK